MLAAPNYWFSGKSPATFGSAVEQSDNEHIPTLESLKKFIPADKLWPTNDTWFMHAGARGGNSTLANIQLPRWLKIGGYNTPPAAIAIK